MEVTIGGNRLGSGSKQKVWMRNYERSTHDLGYVWKSTMAAGTLVPFMKEVALPGDTFDINLAADVLTHPTIGPLFGSYKIQLDVFQVPIRLYQGKLHMNMLGIGMDMSKVPLPQVEMQAEPLEPEKLIDNQHTNPSSIYAYLGVRGLGRTTGIAAFQRQFNAIPYLGYWDIYKQYYANKQEEIGAVIHTNPAGYDPAVDQIEMFTDGTSTNIPIIAPAPGTWVSVPIGANSYLKIYGSNITTQFNPGNMIFTTRIGGIETQLTGAQLMRIWEGGPELGLMFGTDSPYNGLTIDIGWGYYNDAADPNQDTEPEITTFPLENIDTMRQNILSHYLDTPYVINYSTIAPYGLGLEFANPDGNPRYSKQFSQEGIGIKTYQSDLFNNWISTEWIDGANGISEITAVDTSGGSFTIDELNLSKKIYDMLNRIALSGGSYDDWLDAVYTHERTKSAESPIYLGGLIKNLVFQEVISNSASENQPLGTLAGRGVIGQKHKGGKIIAKIDEPSYLIGIVSITPYIDYSQGNAWDVNLKTMNDFHKPALDEIGFQDLITEQMAWWDTTVDGTTEAVTYKSAGKQPAWINYMTNINKVYGNFAIQTEQMFMTLNRRYQFQAGDTPTIADLTTYIDPVKFNHIFADTRRDAQNFWTQIGVDITARRKMSAKQIPNL